MGMLRVLPFVLLMGVSALAQSPTYSVGRTPSAEEIRAWDISIGPTGEELPPGRGTAKEGAQIYRAKGCAGCHGATGLEGTSPNLKSKAGADVELYYYDNPGQEPEQMVSISGVPYQSLPTAFAYRKQIDPTNTCKPEVSAGSNGLRVGPHNLLVQTAPKPNSGVLVFPKMIAPARRSRATTRSSSAGK